MPRKKAWIVKRIQNLHKNAKISSSPPAKAVSSDNESGLDEDTNDYDYPSPPTQPLQSRVPIPLPDTSSIVSSIVLDAHNNSEARMVSEKSHNGPKNKLPQITEKGRPQKYRKIGEKAERTQRGLRRKTKRETAALREAGFGNISSFFTKKYSEAATGVDDGIRIVRKRSWDEMVDSVGEGVTVVGGATNPTCSRTASYMFSKSTKLGSISDSNVSNSQ